MVKIEGPSGDLTLHPIVKRAAVLLAGGIGVTPILCMAERLSNIGADFEMHYCTRSMERTAFAQRITQSAFAERVRFHFDDGPPDQRIDLLALLTDPRPDTHLYICGPTGFMDIVIRTALEKGWPGHRVHREYFAADTGALPGDTEFDVKIASTGRVYRIPKDKTVVAALAAHGIEIPTSCAQGVCGTCLTRVIDGEPLHRDLYQTDTERASNDQFTPCCSRATSAMLVLDL
jgi:vanillate O-demethylase ferredoxin subunit